MSSKTLRTLYSAAVQTMLKSAMQEKVNYDWTRTSYGATPLIITAARQYLNTAINDIEEEIDGKDAQLRVEEEKLEYEIALYDRLTEEWWDLKDGLKDLVERRAEMLFDTGLRIWVGRPA